MLQPSYYLIGKIWQKNALPKQLCLVDIVTKTG
jgi:hypothetical protein